MHICIRIIVIFFSLRACLFVLAPLSERSNGVGTVQPFVEDTMPEVWARSVQCVTRGKLFKTFLALGTLKANPRVTATSPGFGFLHPLSPCTHVRFGCQPGFSARRGYNVYISLLLHRAPRYDPAAQQQSTPLAGAACNSMRVWLLL